MTASVSPNGDGTSMRKLKQRSQSKIASSNSVITQERVTRDSNKRARVEALGEQKTQAKKKAETTPVAGVATSSKLQITCGQEQGDTTNQYSVERSEIEKNCKGVFCTPVQDITEEIMAIGRRNEQLQLSVTTLKRNFHVREEETQQLLLGLGALNAVAKELAALQKDYWECSSKNAVLIQESLEQLSNCSAQVDTLKRCRDVTITQLQDFRLDCLQKMNNLASRLDGLADSSSLEAESFVTDVEAMNPKQQAVKELKDELIQVRKRVIRSELATSVPSCSNLESSTPPESIERMNLALEMLDKLHAEMFQLKQSLVQDNLSFRQHFETLLMQQMACVQDVQDNEAERIHEEMDHMRSGMCEILKDIHRLKERTKYLVPSMARVGFRKSSKVPLPHEPRWFGGRSGERIDEHRSIAISHSGGFSMATRLCSNNLPHTEHDFSDDIHCPGVLSIVSDACYARPRHPRSSKSSNSSPGRSDEDNWLMTTENAPAADQRPAQPCQSPHYSSCSSSLSGRLSAYRDETATPTAEQFEQRLLEQHRLFWISEGAG
ncbi:hypothetical protein CCR75_000820 [Bremia lactucae]|uniref:Uncharacterized protein n=1 Tax=Bremia lactucae TaxID=4779 RepID=A0A976IF27_BRELC|nr:hypothetical protein CCR75_000820 [Bremia lactucae]